jgi:hypothetical protein
MLDTCRDDKYIIRAEVDISVTQLNGEVAGAHHEEFVGLWMCMPDKLALQLHYFDVVVVDARQAARLPIVGDAVKGIRNISNIVCHVSIMPRWPSSVPLSDTKFPS